MCAVIYTLESRRKILYIQKVCHKIIFLLKTSDFFCGEINLFLFQQDNPTEHVITIACF